MKPRQLQSAPTISKIQIPARPCIYQSMTCMQTLSLPVLSARICVKNSRYRRGQLALYAQFLQKQPRVTRGYTTKREDDAALLRVKKKTGGVGFVHEFEKHTYKCICLVDIF